jgi:hypothetical protein
MPLRRFGSPFIVLVAATVSGADAPTPESHLGFRPGADSHLASWPQVVSYFRKVDESSNRVQVRELGQTTEGRPYIMAIVASPETLASLNDYRKIQNRISDSRILVGDPPGSESIKSSKIVVLITCSIHSDETASTLMAMELLHDLATRDDPETREILDQTILLLVPSANPDGVDKIAAWYERSKGHPWEGSGMPELYHKYAGHDTNRDWFMLNLKETQLLTRVLYKEWFPTLTYDVHQMGARGARLFVPPFFDPINPNLDPRIHQSIALIGAHMAADLAANGKRGVLTHAMYDNWWNGGNRTTPQRHNMVGVLTEAAGVKLASPIFIEKDQLRATTRGFSDMRPATNFVDPWPGGWWRLRDIVEYELICSKSILTLAARYKNAFQSNYLSLARDAIAKGKTEPPFAWIVPAEQDDVGRASEMVRILQDSGVEVQRARSSFRADGATFPAGSWILRAAQPYRAHVKDMMERQVYPSRFTATGAAEPPYDVAGWTLPLQMGVRSVAIGDPFKAEEEPVDRVDLMKGGVEDVAGAKGFVILNRSNDDFIVLNALTAEKVDLYLLLRPTPADRVFPSGAIWVPKTERSRAVLDRVLPSTSTRAYAVARSFNDPGDRDVVSPLHPQRIGLYQPWVPSMDEGWTRLVLEKFRFPYQTLHNSDVQAGNLHERIDTLVIPSIAPRILREGWAVNDTEPAYTGGLKSEGIDAIHSFVREGGTLVCFGNSCTFAVEELKLPVNDALKGVTTSTFYGPGSIVRLSYSHTEPLASPILAGMPREGSAYFDRSLAFDVPPNSSARVLARYSEIGPLESGWLLGPEKLQGKAALVEVPLGQGRVILFAFPPQHRGQTHGTFRLLFNTLFRSADRPKT